MEVEMFENPWMKKIRFLTKLLLVSVALNIGLATALIYSSQEQIKKETLHSKKIVLEKSNAEVLSTYFKNSFQELVKELKDKTLLQDGYSKRDLALSCLVNYHYLNLDKAISGKSVQKRNLTFIHQDGGESFHVEVFPNLDDLDFEILEKFIKEEKWPLTAGGLFIDLKKQGSEKDQTLEAAFYMTPEFYMIHTALKRLDETLSKEKILNFLLEGDFSQLQQWVSKTKSGGDFLEGMRMLFQDYVHKGHHRAAELWISLDNEYIQRKLTDLELDKLILLVKENCLSVNIFLKQILCSVRSDEVRKEAALKLYQFANAAPPSPYDHEKALKTFLPTMFAQREPQKPIPVAYTPIIKKHTVTDGDSLWKISRKYKVSIEAIRDHNHLKKDTLKPGQEILIP